MNRITHKSSTLRKATALAIVKVSDPSTIAAVRERRVPKGDVFEFSRAAGLLGLKKTSDVIPDCHPLPVEFASIEHTLVDLTIEIRVEVHTIYKTGVEVEAMHGAAVTALTIYDMLKPIDAGVEIGSIRLEEKQGGKSSFSSPVGANRSSAAALRAAVIVCSDSAARGEKSDTSGKFLVERLGQLGFSSVAYRVIPDDLETIRECAKAMSSEGVDLLLFTGGTGLSPRDVTPEALRPLLEREIPGIMDAFRRYGQDRTPYAMLSRGVAGMIGKTLVLPLPGSRGAVEESMDVLFPHVLHVFATLAGTHH